jgi:hypothetical protein
MLEPVKRVPGSADHVCFPRNQIPRHTTSALPRLITLRAALILYGRPCDRNHCLVQRHFYKVGACLPFVRCFCFSDLVDLTLVLHIAASCHLALQLIASPQPGHKNFQVPSRWGDNSLTDRLRTGSIWFYLFFSECLGGGRPLTSLKMRYSFLIS